MNKPTYIIIHCSDSAWGCAREIDKWHKQRGWSRIGYHLVIMNGNPEPDKSLSSLKGSIECGRELDSEGAHCIGFNENSIGICLIGKGPGTFCIEQFDSLKKLLPEIMRMYNIPAENVLGHGETESGKAEGKTCPNFDVGAIRTWLKSRL